MQQRINKIISNVRHSIQERDFHSANVELDKLGRITVEITTANKFLVSSSDIHRKAHEAINGKAQAIHNEIETGVCAMSKLLNLIKEYETEK